MIKISSGLLLVIFTFLMALVISVLPVQAANPTTEDVAYARMFAKLYKQQEISQINLQGKMIKAGPSLNSAMSLKPFFVENMVFIKDFYLSLYNSKPTPMFNNVHNKMLNGAYKHIDFLKQTIILCNQNVDLQTFQAHVQKRAPITKVYSDSITEFFKIIDTWPEEYARQIHTAYGS